MYFKRWDFSIFDKKKHDDSGALFWSIKSQVSYTSAQQLNRWKFNNPNKGKYNLSIY